MRKTFDSIGQPAIWRNDRFWLAGDHVVDPRISNERNVRDLMHGIDYAREKFFMTENQGSNVR